MAALLAAAAAQAQTLEIIELRHRPADQLLALIRPLLAPGGSAVGDGFKLMVRSTPANLAQIRQAVTSLDRAPRQLLIQVLQTYGAAGAAAGVGVAAAGAAPPASVWDGTGTASDNLSQQVRVLEGNPAFINAGTRTLVRQRSVTRGPGGVVVQEALLPRDHDSGFYVTPRVNGQTVLLDIDARRDTPLGGGAAPPGAGAAAQPSGTSRVTASVSGQIGEWIEIGVVNQANSAERGGLLARSSDAAAQERRILVRVEEVK
jgi:type II secretory pathway component GspD/PulD (secretin)